MHTGYDNFWMYQNIRHEPVLSFSKSDSYSHAALTDSYKSLPNGGSPNHLNNYFIPQSSVASSHQSDQSRMTDSHCVWPSSVYSLTFRSSYANNFQSPETYSSQSTSLNCSAQNSQVQQNYDSRHLGNINIDFPEVCSNTNTNNNNSNNFNNNNCSNSIQAQSTKNNDAPVSRIKVKDVFSLNNNTLHNSVLENNLLQTYQKEQTECALNYATVNHFTSFDSKTPAEYVDYEKISLFESNHICPSSGYTRTEPIKPCDHHKFFQSSNLFYQQNMRLSGESQFQLSGSKEMKKNLPSKPFNSNPLIRQLANHERIWEAEGQNIQKNSCDAPFKSKRIKVQPKRNSSELSNLRNSQTVGSCTNREKTSSNYYTDSLKTNERITQEISKINTDPCSQSHCQKNLSEIGEKSSFSQLSLTEELRKCTKSGQCVPLNSKYSQNQIRRQDDNLVKITIPHTGQSSFVYINDSSSIERSPSLSLSCLLGSKNQLLNHAFSRKSPDHNNCNIENNEVIDLALRQFNQSDAIVSEIATPNTNTIYDNPDLTQHEYDDKIGKFDRSIPEMSSPKKLESSNVGVLLKKHVDLSNHENSVLHNSDRLSENILENVNSKVSIEEKSQSTEAISRSGTISETLIVKQENFSSRIENPSEQSIPEKQVLPQIIKTETNVEDFSLHEHESESPTSENRLLEEAHFLEVDNTENIDFNKANMENIFNAKKPGPKSKIISNALKDSENRIQELNVSVDSGKEKTDFSPKNKIEKKVEKKKVYQSRRNYKSKINREKLDLLIQFLNKDEDTNTSKETEASDYLKKNYFTNKREKEVHVNRNRRKLSKTCIVKNKNNSREMISLISHKVARVEIFKCSSKTSQIAQTIQNLPKSEEKSDETNLVIDRSVDFSENCGKIIKHSQDNQIQQEDCLKSESKEVSGSANKKNQDTSETFLSEKKSSIQEDDISSTMRTFQNLKTHFCMSCDLISSVDSFWINVISGELRCLNCFKKMMIRTEEHILKSKSEKAGDNISSEADLVNKNETNQGSENEKENTHKPGFENNSENCNGLINVTEFGGDRKNSDDLKENIKQELRRIKSESSKDKITIRNDEKVSTRSEYCTVNAINLSNTSRRQSVSVEDKTSLLRKIVEQQNNLNEEESLKKCINYIKWKEDVVHKSGVLKDVPKLEVTELYEESRNVCISERNEITDESQNSLSTKSKQINVLKEKCSVPKPFKLNQSNKEGKNVLKKRSVSPKAVLSTNYKEENLSDQSVSKSDFTESCVANKTQVLTGDAKPGLPNKLEKLSRKSTSKEEYISEEFIRLEKKRATDTSNQNGKKTNANEEFNCQKLQISEEHSKKEIKSKDSLDESIGRSYSKESYSCPKTSALEGIAKRSRSHESSDKLKVQNASKEICSDQKPKIKEMDLTEKSKNKILHSQNLTEKHKKLEQTDQSRKRKNTDEGFEVHKVRIVEEQAKKEIKPVMHSSDISKEENAVHKNKALEHEKQNAKDSRKKSEKNNSSKEECISFGNYVKKQINQMSDSSEKSKTKDDLICQKTRTSNHSKHKRNTSSETSRRRSKDECTSPKPVVTKKHSTSEIKKLGELPDNLRRNSTSKEDSGSVSKHFKIANPPAENRESKTAEEKEKKYFRGRIPKKSHKDLDININEVLRSPLNYGTGEISNLKVKNDQRRINKECPIVKSKRDSFKSSKINSNDSKEKINTTVSKKEKEAFQSGKKTRKETESDSNKRKDQASQMQDLVEQNQKEKIAGCLSEEKATNVAAEELQPNSDGSEKTMLMTKLIKKTKRLSWSLLNVVP